MTEDLLLAILLVGVIYGLVAIGILIDLKSQARVQFNQLLDRMEELHRRPYRAQIVAERQRLLSTLMGPWTFQSNATMGHYVQLLHTYQGLYPTDDWITRFSAEAKRIGDATNGPVTVTDISLLGYDKKKVAKVRQALDPSLPCILADFTVGKDTPE